MAEHKDIDEVSGTATTGHEWDGIKELNTPLPRWWLWTLYATIIWAIGYMIAMPAIPYITGYTKGVLGHSQRAVVAEDVATTAMARAAQASQLEGASLDQVRSDPDLYNFAIAGGRSAFAVNCAQCHGIGGGGAPGYPNLLDDDWLWGSGVEQIMLTVRYGIRSGHDEARVNDMPAFGADGILTGAEIRQVAAYVQKLSGQDHDAALAGEGQQLFAENCVACHREDGTGNRELGAPNLTDGIWLYGGDLGSITASIGRPQNAVMPSWVDRLDPVTIKQLAIYVHALGGGE
ncbi:MAG: cytochrome-c oxidase, cbb3-type subunit III [Alphaproteobacteria bacterium]